jgi:hypothetical protein
MMDAGSGSGELRLVHLFIVIDHERDIQIAVRHVAGYVTARMTSAGLSQAKHVLIKLC